MDVTSVKVHDPFGPSNPIRGISWNVLQRQIEKPYSNGMWVHFYEFYFRTRPASPKKAIYKRKINTLFHMYCVHCSLDITSVCIWCMYMKFFLITLNNPTFYLSKIRKQHRHSPTEATPMADYYIIAGTIYQAPDLASVFNSRLVNRLALRIPKIEFQSISSNPKF